MDIRNLHLDTHGRARYYEGDVHMELPSLFRSLNPVLEDTILTTVDIYRLNRMYSDWSKLLSVRLLPVFLNENVFPEFICVRACTEPNQFFSNLQYVLSGDSINNSWGQSLLANWNNIHISPAWAAVIREGGAISVMRTFLASGFSQSRKCDNSRDVADIVKTVIGNASTYPFHSVFTRSHGIAGQLHYNQCPGMNIALGAMANVHLNLNLNEWDLFDRDYSYVPFHDENGDVLPMSQMGWIHDDILRSSSGYYK